MQTKEWFESLPNIGKYASIPKGIGSIRDCGSTCDCGGSYGSTDCGVGDYCDCSHSQPRSPNPDSIRTGCSVAYIIAIIVAIFLFPLARTVPITPFPNLNGMLIFGGFCLVGGLILRVLKRSDDKAIQVGETLDETGRILKTIFLVILVAILVIACVVGCILVTPKIVMATKEIVLVIKEWLFATQ